jgi:hypothetical protein
MWDKRFTNTLEFAGINEIWFYGWVKINSSFFLYPVLSYFWSDTCTQMEKPNIKVDNKRQQNRTKRLFQMVNTKVICLQIVLNFYWLGRWSFCGFYGLRFKSQEKWLAMYRQRSTEKNNRRYLMRWSVFSSQSELKLIHDFFKKKISKKLHSLVQFLELLNKMHAQYQFSRSTSFEAKSIFFGYILLFLNSLNSNMLWIVLKYDRNK